MSESQTSLTRRLRKKRPVCQPQGKGLSSRKAEDETCSESSSSFRERSECPPSRSIGRPSSSGTQSRRRSNERPPPLSGGAAARRDVRPRPPFDPRGRHDGGGGQILWPRHSSTCDTSSRPRRRQNFGGRPRTSWQWPADCTRGADAALDHTQLFRATPRRPTFWRRAGPPTLRLARLSDPRWPRPRGGECCEAAFSSVLSVRSLLQVEDPDVSNRQPDDREEGSTQFVLSMVGKMAVLLACWYLFLVSLDLLSSAFKLFAGHRSSIRGPKSDVIRNPVVGIMTGLLVTVLVQSSSSSTSITITLVGSQLLSVKQAIPIVMGANLGSSVTSSVGRALS
ncbi:hypothetical protein MTO96_043427, partial [Rhipicephalus appendiculatus]